MERLRTIDQAIAEIRANDPDTALTGWALRQLVKGGELPAIKTGNKYLISIESVERYVNSQLKEHI